MLKLLPSPYHRFIERLKATGLSPDVYDSRKYGAKAENAVNTTGSKKAKATPKTSQIVAGPGLFAWATGLATVFLFYALIAVGFSLVFVALVSPPWRADHDRREAEPGSPR